MGEIFEGYNARVELEPAALVVRRRGAYATLHNLSREPVRVPLEAITAVELRDATRMRAGWLRIGVHGEPLDALAPTDPRNVQFLRRSREDFKRLHAQLEAIVRRNGPPPPPEVADQLLKLADLHAAGVLTDDELATKRRALLERGRSVRGLHNAD